MDEPHLELLAPAGKWDVLEAVIEAGADAAYIGGKKFNMRLLRPGFNFSEPELIDAVALTHSKGKKLYVTVNNLYLDRETPDLGEYLMFLQDIGVDAVIAQDLGLVGIYHRLGLTMPLHASVQMGVSSSAGARLFEEMGFSRVVFSKNLSLAEIRTIHDSSGMEIEFFAHGDLCVSHTGQCYMSSYMKGEGANRGRCLKPCRWKYRLLGDGDSEFIHHLAYKDLCTIDLLPELVKAGVGSLKIEGRMREASFLTHLVSTYRRALDAVFRDRDYKEREADQEALYERRIRDFTTGNLVEPPDSQAVDRSGTREPIFFSHAFQLPRLEDRAKKDPTSIKPLQQLVDITVKVGDLERLAAACQMGVESIIIPGEELRQTAFEWTDDRRREAIDTAGRYGVRVFLETPRIVSEKDLPGILQALHNWRNTVDGVAVNDWGTLWAALQAGFTVRGSYGLNLFNREALSFLTGQGLERAAASLELGKEDLIPLLAEPRVEVLVQGPLCGMISDYCPARYREESEGPGCRLQCLEPGYILEDPVGQKYNLYSDKNCRTYLYYPYQLTRLPELPELAESGLTHIRIDGQFYSQQVLTEIIGLYQQALSDLQQGVWHGDAYTRRLQSLCPEGLTMAPNQVHL
ncbi:MAG: U32 family peptidase [Syntrophomonas sp.]